MESRPTDYQVWRPDLQISEMETRPTGWKLWQKGVMNLSLFGSAGTQVPPQFMEVCSSRLITSRFQPTCLLRAGDLSLAELWYHRFWNPALRVEAMVKRRNGSEPVWYGGDSSPASVHGSLLKQTHNESVSTDLPA